jgi:CRP-like cAMP-binding protein
MPKAKAKFDPEVFLATFDGDRTVSQYGKDEVVFEQGRPANAVFYIQSGKIKILVTSEQGKEAVVAILGTGDFFGEGCLIGQPLRLASALAITDCTITRIEKAAMIRVVQDEPLFAEKFMHHLLTRNSRVEEDLVDQLFNSSEKRLARPVARSRTCGVRRRSSRLSWLSRRISVCPAPDSGTPRPPFEARHFCVRSWNVSWKGFCVRLTMAQQRAGWVASPTARAIHLQIRSRSEPIVCRETLLF